MAGPQICQDTSDAEELSGIQKLYLKPSSKVNICVQLPSLREGDNKSISNWELMEKLKTAVSPQNFLTLKVTKTALEFVRFEAEVENKQSISKVISVLDQKTIKLSGFSDQLKVRAAEGKVNFPTRHDWESFFRDAKNMNEMKPGERPDTLYLEHVPCRWFISKKEQRAVASHGGINWYKPSEFVLKKVFDVFGEVRCVDIPMLDPYRREMKTGGRVVSCSFGPELTFDAYVQYKDYIGFVKAMTAFRGMKLMHIDEIGKAFISNIKVDFDRTKHLSDKSIRKRRLEREHLQQLEQMKMDAIRKQREEEDKSKEAERRREEERHREREERRLAREEKRRLRKQQKKRELEEQAMRRRIAMEERRLLVAQRKLESIRLLSQLFESVKVIKQKEEVERRLEELEVERLRQLEREERKKLRKEEKKLERAQEKKEQLSALEVDLKDSLLKKVKEKEEEESTRRREELRAEVKKGQTRLRSSIAVSGRHYSGDGTPQLPSPHPYYRFPHQHAFRGRMRAYPTEYNHDREFKSRGIGAGRGYYYPRHRGGRVRGRGRGGGNFNPHYPSYNPHYPYHLHRHQHHHRRYVGGSSDGGKQVSSPDGQHDTNNEYQSADVSSTSQDQDDAPIPTSASLVVKPKIKLCSDCGMKNCFYMEHPEMVTEKHGNKSGQATEPISDDDEKCHSRDDDDENIGDHEDGDDEFDDYYQVVDEIDEYGGTSGGISSVVMQSHPLPEEEMEMEDNGEDDNFDPGPYL